MGCSFRPLPGRPGGMGLIDSGLRGGTAISAGPIAGTSGAVNSGNTFINGDEPCCRAAPTRSCVAAKQVINAARAEKRRALAANLRRIFCGAIGFSRCWNPVRFESVHIVRRKYTRIARSAVRRLLGGSVAPPFSERADVLQCSGGLFRYEKFIPCAPRLFDSSVYDRSVAGSTGCNGSAWEARSAARRKPAGTLTRCDRPADEPGAVACGRVEDARGRSGTRRGGEPGRQRMADRERGGADLHGCCVVSPDDSDSRYAERLRPDRRAHLVPVPRQTPTGPCRRFSTSTAGAWRWAKTWSRWCCSTTRKPGDKVVVAVKLLQTVDVKQFRGATLRIDFPESRPNPEDLARGVSDGGGAAALRLRPATAARWTLSTMRLAPWMWARWMRRSRRAEARVLTMKRSSTPA